MCYEPTDRPPLPPISGGSSDGKDIVLTSQDGTKFSAYLAYSDQTNGPQVIIYPDIRGLHQFYKELALRFAEIGVRALAIDYFGRTAGVTPRDDTFQWEPHVQAMTLPTFLMDVNAALAYLRDQAKTPRATFIVGFCRGGTLSLLTSRQDLGLAGIIAFYAGMSRPIPGAGGATLDLMDKARTPILGLFGGADQGIPPSDIERLDQQLDIAKIEHQIVSYPGAPHSFFDRKYIEFANESSDAWTRVINFINAHG
jgi:carboxymethylenebutenolidase